MESNPRTKAEYKYVDFAFRKNSPQCLFVENHTNTTLFTIIMYIPSPLPRHASHEAHLIRALPFHLHLERHKQER